MATPAPSRKSVFKIKSSLLKPALTSHFECWFNPPRSLTDRDPTNSLDTFLEQRVRAGVGKNYDAEEISLYCCEASLPGSSLATHELNNDLLALQKDTPIVDYMMIVQILLFMLITIIQQLPFLKIGLDML